jgi:DNA-binding response OmpR family regulator
MDKDEKKKILIVEDEEVLMNILKTSFEKSDFKALTAIDGEEGFRMAMAEHPDFLLIDILMPKMDGIEMLKEIRKNEWGKKIPAIILTNVKDMERISEATQEGVYDYLIKTDWTIDEIVKKVVEKINK